MKQIISAFVVVMLTALSLPAQTTWTADKSHSKVSFTVTHLLISEVAGRFKDFDATIVASKDDLTDAQIEGRIKTASVDTDNEGRDKHLRSDDFFNAEKFPDLVFKSTGIEKTGEKTYKIKGDLTVRDVTKPVVLDAKLSGPITDPWGNTKVGFKATTTIDRFDYGVKWSKAIEAGGLVVSKEVGVEMNFEFAKKTEPAKGK